MNWNIIASSLIFLASTYGLAKPTPKTSLLIVSKTEHKLALVDPTTYEIITKIPIGLDPHEVVASSDGRIAYVSNTGSGVMHEINAIDLVAQKALANIDTGALLGPHGLKFIGDKLWFTAEGSKSLASYDPKLQKIDWILGVGQNRNHMIEVSSDQKTVYTSNVDSGTVSILENLLLPPPIPPIGAPLPNAKARMGWIQTSLPAGKGVEGLALSPDESELWTANAHAATLTVIDTQKKEVKTTIDTKTLGISRVAFTPDGKRVLISSLRTGDLLIYDAIAKKKLKKIHLAKGAAHILIEANGKRAFVSCTPSHFVAVIDLDKLEMIQKIDVGERPDGMDWAILKE